MSRFSRFRWQPSGNTDTLQLLVGVPLKAQQPMIERLHYTCCWATLKARYFTHYSCYWGPFEYGVSLLTHCSCYCGPLWKRSRSTYTLHLLLHFGPFGCRALYLHQWFPTEVPQNLRVPRMTTRGSTKTDRNCLGRNSQPQFCAVAAI